MCTTALLVFEIVFFFISYVCCPFFPINKCRDLQNLSVPTVI